MTNQNNDLNLIELTVRPIRETFYNEDSYFGIYLVQDLESKTTSTGVPDSFSSDIKITITGNIPQLLIGNDYKCVLSETHHPKYGKQYKVHSIQSIIPSSQDEEHQFLRFFVTNTQFNNIISVYPSPITAILENQFDYKKVRGFGPKTYIVLKAKIESNYENMKAMTVLGGYGIKIYQIKLLIRTYGSADLAIQKVLDNPYILYQEVDGIGFKKADQIAQSIGFDFYSPKRIMAGIMYAIEQEENKGNTWGYISVIKETAEEVLDLEIENIDDFLDNPIFHIDKEIGSVALRRTWRCEIDIAGELYRLYNRTSSSLFSDEDISQYIETIEQELGITYTDEQKKFFYAVNDSNVVVLTGAAGCGKTSILNGCLKMINKKMKHITLVSPTARAAQVLEKSTGRAAGTIHRTLQWTPEGFRHNKNNPLNADIVVVDEASMCDIWIFRSLLYALKDGCKLIVVGDFAQLESISTGNVLNDIVESQVFPVVKLDKVFRQALDSGSLSAATDVRHGIKFYDSTSESLELGVNRDLRLWFGQKDETAKRIALIYKSCLKKWKIDDIMVISPVKKGAGGTESLNALLQELANPQDGTKNQLELNTRMFREQDKVMHIKNDYDAEILDSEYEFTGQMGIFNGDQGYIERILPEEKIMYVNYDGKIIKYHTGNFDQVQLSYAITIHKSQGGQAPVVIMGLDMSGYLNLKRSLVYTGMTRCSKQLFLIAERKALNIAIRNDSLSVKKSFLCKILKNYTSDKIFNN